MKSETLNAPTNENEVNKEQLRDRMKKIGQRASDDSLRQEEIGRAPEGFLSVSDLSEETGLAITTLRNVVDKLNLVGDIYRKENGKKAAFFSPEQQKQICASLREQITTEIVPDGYLTINELADVLGVGRNTLNRKIKELGINGEKYKDVRGQICLFFSPEQQQQIRDCLGNLLVAEKAPDGYLSVNKLATTLGVSATTLRKEIKKIHINGYEYKDEVGKISFFFSPEQQQVIRESLKIVDTSEAPDGYMTVNGLANELGTTDITIRNKAKELHLGRNKYRNKNGVRVFFSPEEQQQIRDALNMQSPPGDYMTIGMMSERLEIGRTTLHRIVAELGMKGEMYRERTGNLAPFFSPEQQRLIYDSLKELTVAEVPPTDFLTAHGFAKKIGMSDITVRNVAERLGINGGSYKSKVGYVATFYSPEEQAMMIESLEQCFANTSIPENAIAYYLTRASQSLQQNLRPDWLKNSETGRNLEIDIFVDSLGVGIEYDGKRWHQDIERDVRKNDIAQKSGYRIIHIREDGCPEMPEGSIVIKRNNNNDDKDLGECINKCFEMLGIPVPDIDVARDKKDIMAFMRQKMVDKLDVATALEELSVVS